MFRLHPSQTIILTGKLTICFNFSLLQAQEQQAKELLEQLSLRGVSTEAERTVVDRTHTRPSNEIIFNSRSRETPEYCII